MPSVKPLGSAPIPFTLEFEDTGTDEYVSTDVLPIGLTGKLTSVVLEVDDSSQLTSCVVYVLSGNGAVSAQPNDRARAFESAALAPADDSPDAFLDEVIDRPQTFRGLRVAFFATWVGACTVSGTLHVDNGS